MLKLDLVRLEKEGSLRLQAAIPQTEPLWADVGLDFATPLNVDLQASRVGLDQILIRGTLTGALAQECRRCLKPVQAPVRAEIAALYGPTDETVDDEDGEIRPVDPRASEIDLTDLVREEVLLSAPAYAECSEGCKGLCPGCGIDLNVETCQCVTEEADSRWDALRALKTD